MIALAIVRNEVCDVLRTDSHLGPCSDGFWDHIAVLAFRLVLNGTTTADVHEAVDSLHPIIRAEYVAHLCAEMDSHG